MRDSGEEDVRAYSCEQGRQLVMEKGGAEAWRGRKELLRAREFTGGCVPLAGRHRRETGLGGDAQPGKESWGQAGGDSSTMGTTGSL